MKQEIYISLSGKSDEINIEGGLDLGSGSVDSVSSINSGGLNLDLGSYLDVIAPGYEGSALDI